MSQKIFSYLRQKSVIIVILVAITSIILTAFLVSADGSNYSNTAPTQGSTISTSNPTISTYVISTNDLDSQTVKMNLNGTPVTPTFRYKGKWVNDYYLGSVWLVLDKREGTISYNAADLKDGLNTVDVSITDKASNVLTNNWSFTVAEPPKFANLTPVDKSEQQHVNQITATITDNTAVDWDTVNIKINNSYVDRSKLVIDQETGTVTYNYDFPTGSYTAILEAKDTAGNKGTKTLTFTVDTTPPNLEYLFDFKDGMTITNGKLKFTAKLKDLVNIKNNITLSLDGNSLNPEIRFDGYTDYYGTYVVTSYKTAYISYEGIVSNGSHTLSLYSEDKLGNQITRTWNFSVTTKPDISEETPIKYGVDDLTPTISALVKSPNGTVKAEGIVLKVNGVNITNFEYDEATGKVTYTPSEEMKNESYQTVSLVATDQTGLSLSREWKFYTNTYPDMKDSNVSSCVSCHPTASTLGTNGVVEEVHSKYISFNGTHSSNSCDNCHKYISQQAGCSQCHSDPNGTSFEYAPHGSTPTIKYGATGFDPYFPIRVKQNRDMVDCIICHQPGSGVKGYNGYESVPTRTLNNHDIPELHKTTEESCTKCHAKSLTHEHARDGRTDKENNPITCNTCHKSNDPQVVKAIADKNTSCTACHTNTDHDSLHVSDLSNNCVSCHNSTLTKEHLNRNLTCATCHESQDSKVVTAIANKDKSCQTCHTVIHKDQHAQCATCHSKITTVPAVITTP